MRSLCLCNNGCTGVGGVPPQLVALHAASNKLESVKELGGIQSLVYLNVADNAVSSLLGLPPNDSLAVLKYV